MHPIDFACSKRLRSPYPEVLTDIANMVSMTLHEHDISGERAEQIAREVADKMAEMWGGQSVYIPIGIFVKLSDRDHKIYAKFNGANHRQLCREFGVGLTRMYRIIKLMAQQLHERQQPGLF